MKRIREDRKFGGGESIEYPSSVTMHLSKDKLRKVPKVPELNKRSDGFVYGSTGHSAGFSTQEGNKYKNKNQK